MEAVQNMTQGQAERVGTSIAVWPLILFGLVIVTILAILLQTAICRRNRQQGIVIPVIWGLLSFLITGVLGIAIFNSRFSPTDIATPVTILLFGIFNIPTAITYLIYALSKPGAPSQVKPAVAPEPLAGEETAGSNP